MKEYFKNFKEKIKNKISYSLLERELMGSRENEIAPEDCASFLSRITYSWTQKMLIYGYFNTLQLKDVPDLPESIKVENTTPILDEFKFKKNEKFGLVWFIYKRFVMVRHKTSIIVQIFSAIVSVLSPLCLRAFILYVQREPSEKSFLVGLFYAVLVLMGALFLSISLQHTYWYTMKCGLEVKGALTSKIYSKTLKLSNYGKRLYSSGTILNLISSDCQNFADYFWIDYLILLVAPIQIIALLALLCWTIGYSGLVGFLIMILSLPLSTFLSSKVSKYQLLSLKYSDKRCNLISEMINGIYLLKLYNWELFFINRIEKQRKQQLINLYKRMAFWALDKMVVQISSALVLVSSFTVYTLIANKSITYEVAFTSISIFSNLREPCELLPQAIQRLLSLLPSSDRICKFLYETSEIIENLSTITTTNGTNQDILITNGTFDWNDNNKNINVGVDSQENKNDDDDMIELVNNDSIETTTSYVLDDINFIAPAGKLTIICGVVGSGKSSLINGLIGEIYKVSGQVTIPNTVSFTNQQPFLVNSTLRENILFGLPMDMDRYKKVLESCSLLTDLQSMPGKDLTEIGERGINLSGGQKQRINLARALYSNSDCYILDEPLSAVDPQVATHLFNHCIQGELMNNKTRILVTHQLQFIPSADHIVVLENGILTQGTYQELKDKFDFESIMKTKKLNLELNNSNNNNNNNNNKEEEEDVENLEKEQQQQVINVNDVISNEFESKNDELNSKLLVNEERETGSVELNIYKMYIKYGSSFIFFFTMIMMYIISQLLFLLFDYWLTIWSDEKKNKNGTKGDSFYILYYLLLVGLFSVFLGIRYFMILHFTNSSSKNLHDKLLKSIGYASCQFFDINSSGRINNRFTKDIAEVDLILMVLSDALYCGSTVLVAVLMMIVINPLIVFPFLLLALFYYLVQKLYRSSSLELKRLENISRSPIFSILSESFNGLITIRSFRQQSRFIKRMQDSINVNLRLFYYNFSAHRWIGIKIEIISSAAVFLSAFFSLFNSNTGLSVLAVTTSLSLTGYLNWCIRQYIEFSMKMSSVERIENYINQPREGDTMNVDMELESNLPINWPQKGEIQFKNVEIKYRPNLKPSLKNISFDIKSNEKIGIVGKSGSGKSTTMLALFRMIECSKGSIHIDGIDISKISLSKLRNSIGICPQEPFIFSGTIRKNIDPFGIYSDSEIWLALEKVKLKETISLLPMKIDTIIHEQANLSFGQKQLLCLTRVLLKSPKLVFFDEHSSSIDYFTAHQLNISVKENITNSTTLTIAHRIDTIIDSDRILVIDSGELIEIFDKNNINNNINNQNSKFKKFVQHTSDHFKNY
ncbi:hypothetical protein ACTFIT_012181 [Dictyostelium discoideum]